MYLVGLFLRVLVWAAGLVLTVLLAIALLWGAIWGVKTVWSYSSQIVVGQAVTSGPPPATATSVPAAVTATPVVVTATPAPSQGGGSAGESAPTAVTMAAPVPTAIVPKGAISPVASGSSLPSGAIVVIRRVDHTAKEIDVRAQVLASRTTFGPADGGMVSIDGWTGYGSLVDAGLAACREAQASLKGSQTPGSWDDGYVISLSGGAVPTVCR